MLKKERVSFVFSSHRPHIHLICDFSDSALYLLQDSLFVYLESKAYLTHDLFLMRPTSSAYSWQCINACDYTFLLIGDSYGQLANTGVSQLHISYLNARTKQKPMVALIKKAASEALPHKDNRQLNDFINLVSLQVKDIIYYDDETDFKSLIENAFQLLKTQQTRVSEIIDANLPIYDLTDGEPVLITKEELIGNDAPPKTDNSDDTLGVPRPKPTNQATPKLVAPKLGDSTTLSCNAHAFQGGTLIEVSFQVDIRWQELLKNLANINAAFSTQGLWKVLNDIATPEAMPASKAQYPEVHAVSRCQVVRSDVLLTQETLLYAGWIERAEAGKEIWQITDTAKQALATTS